MPAQRRAKGETINLRTLPASWLILLASVATGLASTSSGWIDTDAAEKMAKDMREQHMRLIDLDCRQDEATAPNETTSFLMRWEPNSDNRQWSWREATVAVLKGYKREFAGKGFRLVSERAFTMRSGKQRACALWQRKAAEGPAPSAPPNNR